MIIERPYILFNCPRCHFFRPAPMARDDRVRLYCHFTKSPVRLIENIAPAEPCPNFVLEGRR